MIDISYYLNYPNIDGYIRIPFDNGECKYIETVKLKEILTEELVAMKYTKVCHETS